MQTNPVIQDISRQRKMADVLRQQSAPKGQMVSGHFVAPSWTQQLANVLNPVAAGYIDKKANEKETGYNTDKNKAFADILAGRNPRQIQDGTTQPMQAPERTFDQFGSPTQGQDLTPQPMGEPVANTRPENPQEVMARREAETLAYMSKYGNTPESQFLLNKMQTQDNRAYSEQREGKIHDRNRGEQLEDTDAARKYQEIVTKAQQGFQLSMQDKQFLQQHKMQQQNQNFTSRENAASRGAAAEQGRLNRANTLDVATAKQGLQLTKGQEAVDKEVGKEYAAYKAGGGFADTIKQINQLKSVSEALGEKGNSLTGPFVGNIPNSIKAFTDPKALNMQEQVEEVVQRNLRIILGAQFTEKEGKMLIARAYNPRLKPEQNKARVDALMQQMTIAAQTKEEAMNYFEKNGTMTGWGGKLSTMDDFDAALASAGGTEQPMGFGAPSMDAIAAEIARRKGQ